MSNLGITSNGYMDGARATQRNNDIVQVAADVDSTDIYRPAVNQACEPSLYLKLGLNPDMSIRHKFGSNIAVGTTEEDIWSVGGLYPWAITAETIRIKAGGNAADTAAGLGAQSVEVSGLDENWNEVTETLVTAGASASAPSVALFRRINTAKVVNVGTYTGSNTADINIENTTALQVMGNIAAGGGRTQQSQYTVPLGFTAFIQNVEIDVDANQPGSVFMYERQNADDVTGPTYSAKRIIRSYYGVAGQVNVQEKSTVELPEKTDVWLAGSSAAATAAMGVNYDLILVAN
jgi:hypothetical protein